MCPTAGGSDDKSGRERGYGYLQRAVAPAAVAESHFSQGTAGMKEYTETKAEVDRAANKRASVVLSDEEAPGVEAMLERLTTSIRPLIPEQYRAVMHPSQLVAAQPNLHNGQGYLRPHLDEPLHDGFGVVIVTVAIVGSASIIIRSRPWERTAGSEYQFKLDEGQCYVLSGASRNTCLHGVLSDRGCTQRESLNLRFGLHTARGVVDGRFSAWDEIDSHWPQLQESTGAEAETSSIQ